MSGAVEIPYSAFLAIAHELTEGPIGDGRTSDGRRSGSGAIRRA